MSTFQILFLMALVVLTLVVGVLVMLLWVNGHRGD
jgi:hypothetical protein